MRSRLGRLVVTIAVATGVLAGSTAAASAQQQVKQTGGFGLPGFDLAGVLFDPVGTLYVSRGGAAVPYSATGTQLGPGLPGPLGGGAATVDIIDRTVSMIGSRVAIAPDSYPPQAFVRQYRAGVQIGADVPIPSLPRSAAVDPTTHTTHVLTGSLPFPVIGPSENAIVSVREAAVVGKLALPFNPGAPVGGDRVADPKTHRLYVTDPQHEAIAIVDGGAVTGSIPIGVPAAELALDTADGTLYATQANSGRVTVVAPDRSRSTVDTGPDAITIAVDPGRHSAYVGHRDGTVSVIRDGAVTNLATDLDFAAGISVDPFSHRVFVSGSRANTVATGSGPAVAVLSPTDAPGGTTIGLAGDDGPDALPYVVFDRPMDRAATGSAIALNALRDSYPFPKDRERVAGGVLWFGDRVAIFRPTAPLPDDTEYELTVGAGARDTAGRALAHPATSTWRVFLPMVGRASPVDGQPGVAPDAPLWQVFTQEIPESERDRVAGAFSLTKEGGAAVAGTYTWLSSTVSVFVPAALLDPGARYTAVQSNGWTPPLLSRSASRRTFTVAAEPFGQLVFPARDETGVSTATRPLAVFSVPMDRASVRAAFTVRRIHGDTTPLAGTIDFYGDRIPVFTPAQPLAPDTQYVAHIDAGVLDRTGKASVQAITWRFTTAAGAAGAAPATAGSVASRAVPGGAAPLSAELEDVAERLTTAGVAGP